MTVTGADRSFRAGAFNLLQGCAEVEAGESLVLVQESRDLGWYDDIAVGVAGVAEELGVDVAIRPTGGPRAERFDEREVVGTRWDRCIYFARIGDQIRFDAAADDRVRVMSYATTREALGSLYGTTPHQAMLALKAAVDSVFASAGLIELTCSRGTDMRRERAADSEPDDVSIRRFPMGVHTPIDAAGFTGQVAVARYLTPTGSRVYEPPSLTIDDPVLAVVSGGRIQSFLGPAVEVERIEAHYRHVAGLFDLEADGVDSWHAGIHPGRFYRDPAAVDPDRWSNTVFTSPRFAHFHTCNTRPPGEICWMVHDPTIRLAGVALWEDGVLHPERFEATAQAVADRPELATLMALPKQSVGLA